MRGLVVRCVRACVGGLHTKLENDQLLPRNVRQILLMCREWEIS